MIKRYRPFSRRNTVSTEHVEMTLHPYPHKEGSLCKLPQTGPEETAVKKYVV